MRDYVVGIDVGTHSVGMTAIAVDEKGIPVEILSSISHIHDSGIDPDNQRKFLTRKSVSGVARRTRRLYRKKRRRLIQLDKYLETLGWPIEPLESYEDPFLPWKVRSELATHQIKDEAERNEKMSIAVRHIARHRGWRNPYMKVSALCRETGPSDAFVAIRDEVTKATGRQVVDDATVGQLIAQCALGTQRLRGEGGIICARLQQIDHAREIRKICEVQGLNSEIFEGLISAVFKAESPEGQAAKLAGKDPLQPRERRALKASDAFQRYRIAALIGNLRIRKQRQRRLTVEEVNLVFNYLVNLSDAKDPSWDKVAEILGVERGNLVGTAEMTDDGERAGAKPPVHETERVMRGCKIKPLVAWWKVAKPNERSAMIKAISNAEVEDRDSAAGAAVQAFFLDLPDNDFEKLDNLKLPLGRAAYSEDTLEKITEAILRNGFDLYEARTHVFNISKDWVPPAPPIGEPVGNPAVDRVLKVVARWLGAAIREWGAPSRVNIEHVRSGFSSLAQSKKLESDNKKREKRNKEILAEMQSRLNIQGKVRRADLWRFQSVQRQNGQCAYCGTPITYFTCEIDHIVPRAGQGSTNKRENLIAACQRCNQSKSNIPFARWARECGIPGVSVEEAIARTNHWIRDSGLTEKDFNKFVQSVQLRLKRETIDTEIDARSLESVAWMANELRARIEQHLKKYPGDHRVRVYRGALTAQARLASGISGNLRFIDGVGKTRFDRRHHAVDAAVIAFTTPTVAETLARRADLRFEQELKGPPNRQQQWREFKGTTPQQQIEWHKWKHKMAALGTLLQQALTEDEIIVMSNLRLRLGNGAVHKVNPEKLKTLRVGDAISLQDINRASSEALWCALTRHPDFDENHGLNENPARELRVHGKILRADDQIKVFPVEAGAIMVRGGYVELGNFHHARIYKIPKGKNHAYAMLRVFAVDLAKYRNEDLFTVQLKPQSISMRHCDSKLLRALAEGTARYLGWLVIDDELELDGSKFGSGQIGDFQRELGQVNRWRVDGFVDSARIRLRPIQMSQEGIDPAKHQKVISKMVDRPGWRASVNQVFATGHAQVIRRDSLGRVRNQSAAHLPTSWRDEENA